MPRIGLPDIKGQLKFDTGTAAVPSIGFSDDPDTGIYTDTADILSFTTAGTRRMSILSDGALEFVDITAPGVTTNKLYSVSGNLFWDGNQVDVGGGGVQNPMTSDLDVGGFDIIGSPPVTPTSSGGDVEIRSGAGGATSGNGGALNLFAGNGSTAGSVSISAGDGAGGYSVGGAINLSAGDGYGPTQDGGDVTLTPGAGSGSGVEGTVRLGGALTWTTSPFARQIRAGAAGDTEVGAGLEIISQDNASGVGGDLSLSAGDGGGAGDGGAINITSGAGGTDYASTCGAITIQGANSILTAASTYSYAGNIDITGGTTSTSGAQFGGHVFIRAGNANTGTYQYGGDVRLWAGECYGSGASSRGGNLSLRSGSGSSNAASGDIEIKAGGATGSGIGGGNIAMTAASVLTGSATAGGQIIMYGGTGASALGAVSGNAGGAITLVGGDGGNAVNGTAGVGGAINLTAGTGGDETGTGIAGGGGAVNITGGQVGGITISGVTGGDVNLTGGSGGDYGGDVVIRGGPSPTSGGGNIRLIGGQGDGIHGFINIETPIDTLTTQMRFLEAPSNGTNYVAFRAPSSITTNRIWTLFQDNPSTVSGQFITTDSSGVLSFSATIPSASYPLLAPDGSLSAPSYSFSNETNSGIFRPGTGSIVVTIQGTERLRISNLNADFSVPVQIDDGTASSPTFRFNTDTNTGFFKKDTDHLGITTGGNGSSIKNGSTTTTGTIAQNIVSIPVASGTSVRVRAEWVATDTTNSEGGHGYVEAAAFNNAGTLTSIAGQAITNNGLTTSSGTVTVNYNDTSDEIEIQANGAAATNINWSITANIITA